MGKSSEHLPPSEALPGIDNHSIVFHNGKGYYYTCKEYSSLLCKRVFECANSECNVTAIMSSKQGSPLVDNGNHSHTADLFYRDKCILLHTIRQRFLEDSSPATLILQDVLSSLSFEEDSTSCEDNESITLDESCDYEFLMKEPSLEMEVASAEYNSSETARKDDEFTQFSQISTKANKRKCDNEESLSVNKPCTSKARFLNIESVEVNQDERAQEESDIQMPNNFEELIVDQGDELTEEIVDDPLGYNQQDYSPGEFVYAEPKEEGKDPIMLNIQRLWTRDDGHKMVYANQYYRPHELQNVTHRLVLDKEVFRTDLFQSIPLDNVLGRCCVLNFHDYLRLKPENFEEEDVYVCDYEFSFRSNSFKRIKHWPDILKAGYKLILRDKALEPKRVMFVALRKKKKPVKETTQLTQQEVVMEEEVPVETQNIAQTIEVSEHYCGGYDMGLGTTMRQRHRRNNCRQRRLSITDQDGYMYCVNRTVGNTKYLRCSRFVHGCNARAVIRPGGKVEVQPSYMHNHKSDPRRVAVREFTAAMIAEVQKEMAKDIEYVNYRPLIEIFKELVARYPDKAAYVTYENVRRSIRRSNIPYR